jgi:hypothetical protein
MAQNMGERRKKTDPHLYIAAVISIGILMNRLGILDEVAPALLPMQDFRCL